MIDEYGTPLPPDAVVEQPENKQAVSTTQSPTQSAPVQISAPQDEYGTPIPQDAVIEGQQSGQSGFLQRTYETSGLKGLVDQYKQHQEQQKLVTDQIAQHVKNGEYGHAAEAILKNLIMNDPAVSTIGGAAKGFGQGVEGMYEKGKEAIDQAKQTGEVNPLPIAEAAESYVKGIPVIGPLAESIIKPTTEDIYNKNYSGIGGDVTGTVLQALLASAFGETTAGEEASAGKTAAKGAVERADTANIVRPSTKTIAGQEVPVSTPQLTTQSGLSKQLTKVASKEGAQKFINEQVQPAAQKALQSNFSQTAASQIDELRQIRGEPIDTVPKMETLDDISSGIEKEAKKTYEKLDDASRMEQAKWQAKNKAAEATNEPSKIIDPETGEPVAKQPVEAGEKPLLFSELQDKINSAERTMKSRIASVTDKASAAENLPKYRAQMDAFLKQNKDVVESGELGKADNLWKQSQQFKFIDKNVRTLTKGTEAVSDVKGSPITIDPNGLERLRARFDNKYGVDSFNNLLGKDGLKNYNDVINILKNPIERDSFNSWMSNAAAGGVGELAAGGKGLIAGLIGKIGVTKFADNLLFNPKFGQTLVKLWRDETGTADFSKLANIPFSQLVREVESISPEDTVMIKKDLERRGIIHPGQGKVFNENLTSKRTTQTQTVGTSEGAAQDTQLFQEARKQLGPNASMSEVAQRAQKLKDLYKSGQPKSITTNASGESSASQEAINRMVSERSQGIRRFKITKSGQEVPLFGPDAVDMSAGKGETIIKRFADGHEEIQDQGQGARYNPKSSTTRQIYQGTKSVLAGK